MRPKDKVEKYLNKLVKKYNGSIVESARSRYYSIKGHVLRVSDHVGKNSDGSVSIILDNSCPGSYIVHGHSSGNLVVLNYEQLKEFVRVYIKMSFIFGEIGNASAPLETLGILANNHQEEENADTIKGFKSQMYLTFTPNQIKSIKSYIFVKRGGNTKLAKAIMKL